MDGILDFDILNETISYDPDVKDFKEFCNNLDSLGVITNPELYIEAMVDHNKSWADKFKVMEPPFKNTRQTTKDVKKAYNDITDGGGSVIRAVWDMSMKAVQLCARIIKFVLLNLAKIPKMIVSMAQTVGRIPANVKNKIRGNVNLYVTVNDVDNLFKKLIPILDNFLADANQMSKGDMWGTFFNRRAAGSKFPSKYIMTENDMAYYKKMKSSYERVKLIEFKPTTVLFENQNVIDIYFGGSKSIQYTDANGRNIKSTYYESLVHIFNQIREQDEFLKRVQSDMGEKFDKSQMNQAFGRLDESAKKIVGESIQMISKVVNIIGNLMRYVMTDIKTLRNSADKILKRDNVPKVKNESVMFTESKLAVIERKRKSKFSSLFGSIFGSKTNQAPPPPKDPTISPDGNDMELMDAVIAEFNALTTRKSVSISTSKAINPLKRTQSKFGGIPYWPKDKPYPIYTSGEKKRPYVMIAQINLAEVPAGLKDFPTKGILQFFVDSYATYDTDCKVVYHDRILSDDKLLSEVPITTLNLADDDEFPFSAELELNMQLEEVPMTIDDYRFNNTFMTIFNKHFKTDIKGSYWKINNDKIEDIIYENYSHSGSRLDGYPYFTQRDYRYDKSDKDILLLQIDSDDNLMWGDCGVANFFINEKDLKAKKFDNVIWGWDCH